MSLLTLLTASRPVIRSPESIPCIGLSLMDADEMNGPAADKTMSSTEAAAYLSGLVGYGDSAEVLKCWRA